VRRRDSGSDDRPAASPPQAAVRKPARHSPLLDGSRIAQQRDRQISHQARLRELLNLSDPREDDFDLQDPRVAEPVRAPAGSSRFADASRPAPRAAGPAALDAPLRRRRSSEEARLRTAEEPRMMGLPRRRPATAGGARDANGGRVRRMLGEMQETSMELVHSLLENICTTRSMDVRRRCMQSVESEVAKLAYDSAVLHRERLRSPPPPPTAPSSNPPGA